MPTSIYLPLSALFFILVALLHFLRLIYQIPVQVGEVTIPMWISVGGTIVPGFFGIVASKLSRELCGSKNS